MKHRVEEPAIDSRGDRGVKSLCVSQRRTVAAIQISVAIFSITTAWMCRNDSKNGDTPLINRNKYISLDKKPYLEYYFVIIS